MLSLFIEVVGIPLAMVYLLVAAMALLEAGRDVRRRDSARDTATGK